MHAYLDQLTATIRDSSVVLRSAYEPEKLYAWRVATRRVRSLLKPLSGSRVRRLRRSWGAFLRVTNPARDWDVFLRSAAELLPPQDLLQFEQDNAVHLRHSHDAVLAMLSSSRWAAHLESWTDWLERSGNHRRPARPDSLPRALARAQRVLATARTQGDSRAWHKFRIAVKEVRYLAEGGTAGDPPAPTEPDNPLIERCKQLQSLLGAWHDSVVQAHLLVDLAPSPVHDRLLLAVRRRQERQLADIVAAVTDQPLFPAFEPAQISARSASSSGS